jgi:hypothetical protein
VREDERKDDENKEVNRRGNGKGGFELEIVSS